MVSPVVLHRYSFADYLALEEASNTKHEFLTGEIYARAGGTPGHSALAVAVTVARANQLRGGPCRVFNSGLRVRVLATGLATYPDVTVVCGPLERDPEGPATITNPQLVVEVLSESTEAYDRGQKLDHYRHIPSLQAVVLISHRKAEIDPRPCRHRHHLASQLGREGGRTRGRGLGGRDRATAARGGIGP